MIHKIKQQISIPAILKISDNELSKLGGYLEAHSFKNVACFYSYGIQDIIGGLIDEGFNKHNINVIYEDIIDDIDIEKAIKQVFKIPKSTDALIGVGGGKAIDYSKYCAHVLGLPFISVPTSTSNDGFCSPLSSLMVEGKRITVRSTIPYGVIADINIIKTSPKLCIYSGVGDLISKITAGFDWQMAKAQSGESFNDFGFLISQDSVKSILNYDSTQIRSSKFLYELVYSLFMNGISMEIAGSTRPASGSEHLISHALDSISEKPAMHGIQVGIATYICSYIQNNQHDLIKEFFIKVGLFDYVRSKPLKKKDFIDAIKISTTIKQDFITILSIQDNIDKAIDFVNTDEYLQKILC